MTEASNFGPTASVQPGCNPPQAHGEDRRRPFRLDLARSQLLVIDIQGRLMPHIDERERVLRHGIRMIQAARELGLPMTLTEQYTKGLGPTDADVLAAYGDAPRFEKMTFSSCCGGDARGRVISLGRPQVLIVGVEAHVCVLQSVLDLLEIGMTPVLLADAVSSRRPVDRDNAFLRMRGEGVMFSTVESAIYEFMHVAGTELFKRLLPILK